MTVQNNFVRAQYPLNPDEAMARAATYAFNSKILNEEHLNLILVSSDRETAEPLVLGTDFSVAIRPNGHADISLLSGSTMVFAGKILIIINCPEEEQDILLNEATPFPAKTIERGFDNSVLLIQKLNYLISKSISINDSVIDTNRDGEITNMDLEVVTDPALRPGHVLEFFVDDTNSPVSETNKLKVKGFLPTNESGSGEGLQHLQDEVHGNVREIANLKAADVVLRQDLTRTEGKADTNTGSIADNARRISTNEGEISTIKGDGWATTNRIANDAIDNDKLGQVSRMIDPVQLPGSSANAPHVVALDCGGNKFGYSIVNIQRIARVRDPGRAADPMANPPILPIVDHDLPRGSTNIIQIELDNVHSDGVYQLFILKGLIETPENAPLLGGDMVRLVVATQANQLVNQTAIAGAPNVAGVLEQNGGVVKVEVHVENNTVARVFAVPIPGGGAAAGGASNLDVLLENLQSAGALSPGDQFPILQPISTFRPEVTGQESATDSATNGYIVDQTTTPPDLIRASYDQEGAPGNRVVFMATTETVINAVTTQYLMNQAVPAEHGPNIPVNAARRTLVIKDSRGLPVQGAVIVDPTNETVVLIIPRTNENIALVALQDGRKVSRSARVERTDATRGRRHRLLVADLNSPDPANPRATWVDATAYIFSILPAEHRAYFPTDGSVDGMRLFFELLSSATAQGRPPHLGIFFANLTYISVPRGLRAKLLSERTLFEAINTHTDSEVNAAEARLNKRIDGISGQTLGGFSLTLDEVNDGAIYASSEDVPASIKVSFDVDNAANAPGTSVGVMVNGFPVFFPNVAAGTSRTTVDWATAMSVTGELNAASLAHIRGLRLRDIPVELVVYNAQGQAVYTPTRTHVHLAPPSSLPDVVENRLLEEVSGGYVESGATSTQSSFPAYLERHATNLRTLTLLGSITAPFIAYAANGDKIEVATNLDIPISLSGTETTNAQRLSNERITVNPSTFPAITDTYLAEQRGKRIGEFTFDDKFLGLLPQRTTGSTPLLDTLRSLGSVILRVGNEFMDATLLRAPTDGVMDFALKRAHYMRNGVDTHERTNIVSSSTFLAFMKVRVTLDSAGTARFYTDLNVRVPAGEVQIGVVGVNSSGQIVCFRPEQFWYRADRNNDLSWEFLGEGTNVNDNYRCVDGGTVEAFGKKIPVPENFTIGLGSNTTSLITGVTRVTSRSGIGLDLTTDGDYDLYWYLTENGSVDYRLIIPNYSKRDGWHHPFENWPCILKTRIRVTENGRTLRFLQDYNGYPYQLFSQKEDIPLTDATLLDTTLMATGNRESVNSEFILSLQRVAAISSGLVNIYFKPGVIREFPAISGSQEGDAVESNVHVNSRSGAINAQVATMRLQRGANRATWLNLSKVGRDARQARLDNKYN